MIHDFVGEAILIENFKLVRSVEERINIFDLQLPFEGEKDALREYGKVDGDFFVRCEDEDLFGKSVYIRAEVCADKVYGGVFDFISNVPSKLWVNEHCVMIHQYPFLQGHHSTAELKLGINEVIIGLDLYNANSRFSLRISDYSFEIGCSLSAKTATNPATYFDPAILISDYFYQEKAKKFHFMIFKNRNLEYEEKFKIRAYDSEKGDLLEEYGRLNELIILDVDAWRKLSGCKYRFERVDCILFNKDGTNVNLGFCIILNDFREEEKRCRILDLRKYPTIVSDYVNGLYKISDFYEQVGDMNLMFWNSMWAKEFLEKYNNTIIDENYYRQPGIQQVFIKSKLDNSYVKIQMNIPEHYDERKKYPLFMTIAFNNEGDNSNAINRRAMDEDIIHVDVTGRAFTGGSYIGEASILEIFEWVKNHLSIDENRVYLMGQSSGGYGVWAMAQNYPHLFAGLFPLAGLPNEKMISNIYNIPTYYFASEQDFIMKRNINKVKSLFKNKKNFVQENIPNITHGQLCYYSAHATIMNLLLKNKREEYPCDIKFRTCRNRHSRAYYIKILGIEDGKTYGGINVKSQKSRIDVTTEDINGFEIRIPPYVEENFVICLNGTEYMCTSKRKLLFKKNVSEWSIVEKVAEIDYVKGVGLLHVYLDKMKIMLNNNATNREWEIAKKFSEPLTNAVNSKIFVKYPICKCESVDEDCNYVVIAHCDSVLAKKYTKNMRLKCYGRGYSLFGKEYEGSYCGMEIINNDNTNRRSVLLVIYNDEKMLRRNILLRRITIPTYYNGIHPYWNNEILCFDSQGYSAVYDSSDEIYRIE